MSNRDARNELTRTLADCDRGAFPGSKAWLRETQAIKALVDFDATYPEVLASIRRENNCDDKDILGV